VDAKISKSFSLFIDGEAVNSNMIFIALLHLNLVQITSYKSVNIDMDSVDKYTKKNVFLQTNLESQTEQLGNSG
jgi:hypothetical protein